MCLFLVKTESPYPAMALLPNLEVVARMTNMKRKVMTASITKALRVL
jgi:hypothetical protein